MEGKRLSDDTVLKTDPRYRKLEHLIQVSILQRENILLHNPLINFTFTQSGGQSQIQDDEDLAVTEDEVGPQQNPLLGM